MATVANTSNDGNESYQQATSRSNLQQESPKELKQQNETTTKTTDKVEEAYISQPVKRRTNRAREKSHQLSERPRSWHASKHEPSTSEHQQFDNMRSPQQQQQHNMIQQRRRSRGWTETGELKSAYHHVTSSSRDSLLSTATSNLSTSRLSISTSSGLSSERMSASRGSLDNLLEQSHHHHQGSRRGGVVHPSLNKLSSGGIVTKNKSMFEQLSTTNKQQQARKKYYKGSHDSLDKIGQIYNNNNKNKLADSRKSSVDYGGKPGVTSSSVTSPLDQQQQQQRRRQHSFTSAGAPEPPQRDSSVEKYKILNKNRLNSSPKHMIGSDDRSSMTSSSTSPPPPTPNDTAAAVVAERKQAFVKAIHKNIETGSGRQERVFGVVSTKTSPLAPTNPNPTNNNNNTTQQQQPLRYERLKEYQTPQEANAGRVYTIKMQDSSSSNVQHVRSSSIDGEYDKSKGASSRYGVVWKAPQQQHGRSRSIDSTLSSDGGASKFVFPQPAARQPDGGESRRNDDYEMIWLSTNNSNDQIPTNSSPPPQYKTASQLELEKQRSKLNNNRWPDYKSSDLDVVISPSSTSPNNGNHDVDDEAFTSQPTNHNRRNHGDDDDRYCDHIKHMSNEVLSKTSFTRPHLNSSSHLSNTTSSSVTSSYSKDHQRNNSSSGVGGVRRPFQASQLSEQTPQPAYFHHSRSQSQAANEEDNRLHNHHQQRLLRHNGAEAMKSGEHKSRPRSAGYTTATTNPNNPPSAARPRNLSQRTSMRGWYGGGERNYSPPMQPPPNHHLHQQHVSANMRKSDSFPRSQLYSSTSDMSSSSATSPPPAANVAASIHTNSYQQQRQNRRILIDVKPDPALTSSSSSSVTSPHRHVTSPSSSRDVTSPVSTNQQQDGGGEDKRKLVIEYFKKQVTSPHNHHHHPSNSSPVHKPSSNNNSNTSSNNLQQQRTSIRRTSPMSRYTSDEGLGSSSSMSLKSSSPSESSQSTYQHQNNNNSGGRPRNASVRKSKNFYEKRERFNQTHASDITRRKSVNVINNANMVGMAHNRNLKISGRASSMDNLLQSDECKNGGIDVGSSGSQLNKLVSGSQNLLSSTTSSAKPGQPKMEPPPRLKHRSRHSNSSTASSVTTASTLSSLSSTSSASIITYPAVINEEEKSTGDNSTRSGHFIDTGTFRVKRRNRNKSPPRSEIEAEVTSPQSEADDAAKMPPPPPRLPEIPHQQQAKANEILDKVKITSQPTDDVSKAVTMTPPPPSSGELCEEGERLLRKMSLKRDVTQRVRCVVKSRDVDDDDDDVTTDDGEQEDHVTTSSSSPSGGKTDEAERAAGDEDHVSEKVSDDGAASDDVIENAAADDDDDDDTNNNNNKTINIPQVKISSEPLLPDISLTPALSNSIIDNLINNNQQQQENQQTENKSSNKVEESTPTTSDNNMNMVQQQTELTTNSNDDQQEETPEDIIDKKMKLIVSLREKLTVDEEIKSLLDVERKEIDGLGEQVNKMVNEMCDSKQYDKYVWFVREVDNIIKLLISLSGRLKRIEHSLATLHTHDTPERTKLMEKRRVVMEQHEEAKQLKSEIDEKQKRMSEMLATKLNHEQFADYEHFIKSKSSLIIEQREFEDKIKLCREQVERLKDGLPPHLLKQVEADDDDV